jgi:hypothetical protein
MNLEYLAARVGALGALATTTVFSTGEFILEIVCLKRVCNSFFVLGIIFIDPKKAFQFSAKSMLFSTSSFPSPEIPDKNVFAINNDIKIPILLI